MWTKNLQRVVAGMQREASGLAAIVMRKLLRVTLRPTWNCLRNLEAHDMQELNEALYIARRCVYRYRNIRKIWAGGQFPHKSVSCGNWRFAWEVLQKMPLVGPSRIETSVWKLFATTLALYERLSPDLSEQLRTDQQMLQCGVQLHQNPQ